MKKLLGILSLALCLVGCSDGPDEVVVAYFRALSRGDFDKVSEYVSEDTKPSIKMMADVPDAAKDAIKKFKGVTFKVVKTKIDGDDAIVKIQFEKDDETGTDEYCLIKEDGDWKVDMVATIGYKMEKAADAIEAAGAINDL